jgi:hypothetical protein
VPQNADSRHRPRNVAGPYGLVGVAEATGANVNQYLRRAWRADGEVDDLQRVL